MGKGTSTQQTEQRQTSETEPWNDTIPLLRNVIGKLGSVNTDPTTGQTAAINQMSANADTMPNYTPQVQGLLSDALNSKDRTPVVNDAYSTLQTNLTPYASGSRIGGNPAVKGWLDTISSDATDRVNGIFGAAGRDLSPAHAQALARGITQGTAPVAAGQYNQDVSTATDAAKTLYSGGVGAATANSGLDDASLARQFGGVQGLGMLPGIMNMGPTSKIAAESLKTSLPFGNLGMLTSILGPIAGLGGQSKGNSSGTAQNTMSDAQQAWGWMNAGSNMFGKVFPKGLSG